MDPQSFANIGPNIKALVHGFSGIDPEAGGKLVKVSQIAWGNIASMTKHFGKIGTNMALFSGWDSTDLAKNATKALESGCNLVLHCNGNIKEMRTLARLMPKIDKFTVKKHPQSGQGF